jgi:putative FmdB family regulatory protein
MKLGMPLYEYKCHSCGHTFEVIEKFSSEPLKTHPECGGTVERLISAPAVHFKGTGWYVTDYARSNGVKTDEARAGEAKSETKADAGKTEAGSSAESKPAESKSRSKSGAAETKAPSSSPPPVAAKPSASKSDSK